MDVRASDSEREACIERLRTAAAEGRLTMDELAERIETASAAVMREELVSLTSDLPGRSNAPDGREVKTAGDIKRSGKWVVPPENHFRSYFGAIRLDLRKATLSESETRIHAQTYFGNVVLLVPGDAPRIVVTGGTMFGDVKVRRGRRWRLRRG
jgi:hypothetical protein